MLSTRALASVFGSCVLLACAASPAPEAAAPARDLSDYQVGDKTELEIGPDAPDAPKAEPVARPLLKAGIASQGQKRSLYVIAKKSSQP